MKTKVEPTVEKWRDEIYNAICLVNLTDRVGEGIKKVIEVFKKYQAQSVQEAKAEERERIQTEMEDKIYSTTKGRLAKRKRQRLLKRKRIKELREKKENRASKTR